MKRGAFLASSSLALAAGVAPAAALVPATSLRDKLKTRAELTDYREASTVADVSRLLAELDLRGAPIAHGSIGTTFDAGSGCASTARKSAPSLSAMALSRSLVACWYRRA